MRSTIVRLISTPLVFGRADFFVKLIDFVVWSKTPIWYVLFQLDCFHLPKFFLYYEKLILSRFYHCEVNYHGNSTIFSVFERQQLFFHVGGLWLMEQFSNTIITLEFPRIFYVKMKAMPYIQKQTLFRNVITRIFFLSTNINT